MALRDQIEIDEIDSLLGEEEPRRRPRIEQPAPMVQEAPLVGGLSTGPYAAFSREPSAGMDTGIADVGARGGATTQPVGAPRPVEPTFGASGVFDPEDRRPDPPPLVPSDQSAPPAPRPTRTADMQDANGDGIDDRDQLDLNRDGLRAIQDRGRALFGTTQPTPAPDAGTGVPGTRSTGASRDTASDRPAQTWEEAYEQHSQLDPNLPPDEMEAAIERIYGHLPGYGGAYKESVQRNGQWLDTIGGYGGPNASFHGMMAKTGGKGAGFSAGLFGEGGGMPEIDNTSRLDQILASIDAMARGEGGPLVTQSIDELLGQAGGTATGASRTPMVDQSAPMARPAARRVPARGSMG